MTRSCQVLIASIYGSLLVCGGLAIAAESDLKNKPSAPPSLREAILSRTFFKGHDTPADRVLCAIMDADLGFGVATLAAFSDGTVSLYFANGGGMIGLGGKPAIRAAAGRFLSRASKARKSLHATTEFPFPEGGAVTFYLVTSAATYSSGPVQPETTKDRDSPFHDLFEKADQALTEIRLSQDK